MAATGAGGFDPPRVPRMIATANTTSTPAAAVRTSGDRSAEDEDEAARGWLPPSTSPEANEASSSRGESRLARRLCDARLAEGPGSAGGVQAEEELIAAIAAAGSAGLLLPLDVVCTAVLLPRKTGFGWGVGKAGSAGITSSCRTSAIAAPQSGQARDIEAVASVLERNPLLHNAHFQVRINMAMVNVQMS